MEFTHTYTTVYQILDPVDGLLLRKGVKTERQACLSTTFLISLIFFFLGRTEKEKRCDRKKEWQKKKKMLKEKVDASSRFSL